VLCYTTLLDSSLLVLSLRIHYFSTTVRYALFTLSSSYVDCGCIYIFSFGRYDLSENSCHVDLKEQEFVRCHFLSLWGPVLVDAAVKWSRDRQTTVHLFVDCRTPLFSCWWHCHVVKCAMKGRVTHTTRVTF